MNQLLGHLFFALLRILDLTYRYRYANEHKRKEILSGKPGNYIYALWHQNIVSCLMAQKNQPHIMVVSPSKDGEFVAIACEKLGHSTARGSSSREGRKAMIKMIKTIRGGAPGAISVDGPKGPAKVVKKGIVEIAKTTNSVILPYATYPEKYWSFNSWDQFRLPKPFSRIIIHYGEPIIVSKDLEKEEFDQLCEEIRQKLESAQSQAKAILSDPQTLSQCAKSQK